MRGTVAKRLRALAKTTWESYGSKPLGYVELTERRKIKSTKVTDADGNPVLEDDGITEKTNKIVLAAGTIVLANDCERMIYNKIKSRFLELRRS